MAPSPNIKLLSGKPNSIVYKLMPRDEAFMTGLDKVNKVFFISRVCCFFVWCCGVMIGPARALDLDRRTQPPKWGRKWYYPLFYCDHITS